MSKTTPQSRINLLNEVVIHKLETFKGTLGELESIISELCSKYGRDAQIELDAGYNNVEVKVSYEMSAIECNVNVYNGSICKMGTKGCIAGAHNEYQ